VPAARSGRDGPGGALRRVSARFAASEAWRGRRLSLALAAGLAAAQAGLLMATAWDKSDVIDEAGYLLHGVAQVNALDFGRNCEAPALPKWGFGIALRLADPAFFAALPEGHRTWDSPLYTRELPQLRKNLFAARLGTILVTVAGGLLLWAAACRFGRGVAFVTHALWCFSPTVLAYGSLAKLDGWAGALACGVLWAGVRLVERPGASRAAAAGVACGLAATTKATLLGAIPFVVLFGGGALVRRCRREGRGPVPAAAGAALAYGAALLLTVWTVYGFTVGVISLERGCRVPAAGAADAVGPLPFPMYVKGVLNQWEHGRSGHAGFLFGEVGSEGWWWFYLAAIALRTTLGAQALALLRLASWIKVRPPRAELSTDAAILAYPALLLVVLSAGRTQNGIQYILPAFPFGMLWVGRGAADVSRAFGRAGRIAAGAALLAAVAGSLFLHPDYLMFFNAWAGGPEGGARTMIVGADVGQDQRRLAEWQRAHGIGRHRFFYTAYSGHPDAWGLLYRRPRCEPTPGVHALQAVEVFRPKRVEPGCLDWLTVEPPDEVIGHSIYIYRVDAERIARLERERGTREPFWRSGPAP
jgi:Dolichyl-phosphate-mannose-protein mannosyltransferase